MLYLSLATAPIIALMLFVYLKDKYEREPLGLCLKIALFGAIATAPILLFEILISKFEYVLGNSQITIAFWHSFMVAGLVEETFKFLVIYLFIWKNKNFNEPFDGIVYAVFASLGFALVENILYVFQNGAGTGFLRAFTAVPAHTMFGITMGYFFGIAKFSNSNKTSLLATSLIVPIVIHGFYDFILMSQSTLLLLLFVPFLIGMLFASFRMMKSHGNESPFKDNVL